MEHDIKKFDEYADVLKATQQIIDFNHYQLFNDYANLFEAANENNLEVIS